MEKRYKIVPRRGCYIPGILPDGRHITSTIILNNLNQRELIACMKRASVYALVNGKEIHISTPNIKDAEKLFDELKPVINDIVSITPDEQVDSSDECKSDDSLTMVSYTTDNELDLIIMDKDTSVEPNDADEAVEDKQIEPEINDTESVSEFDETDDNDQLKINDTEHIDNESIEKNLEQPSPTEKNNRGGNSQKNNNHYNKPRRREYKK